MKNNKSTFGTIVSIAAMIFLMGVLPITVSAATLNVTSLGVTANSLGSSSANTTNINSIISSASSGSIIYFPVGTYYISGCIEINSKNNVIIRGENATIVNTAYSPYDIGNTNKYMNSRMMNLYNCTDLIIEGLNFDYYYFTSASGTITSKSGGYTYIKLFDEYYDGVSKPKLLGGEFAETVNIIGPDAAPRTEYWATNQATGYTTVMSDATNGIYGVNTSVGNVGDKVVIRFTLGTYASPTFVLQKNYGVQFNHCNVYSSPSATFYALAVNENLTFNGLSIAPKTGSKAIWSSNVDGIHIKGLKGFLTMKDCTFIGLGDDSLNVHSRAAKISSITSNLNKIAVIDGYDQSTLSSDWCEAGDTVEFFDANFTSLGTAIVQSYSNGMITLDAVPSNVTTSSLVENRSMMPTVSIDNCHVSNSRARAFVIQTKNVEIKNCTLENLRLAAIIVAPDVNKWYEMGPSEHVYIHNNTFRNVCALLDANNYGAITVRTRHDAGGTNPAAGVHKNMKIEANNFTNIGSSCIYATSTSNLDILNNIFINYGTGSNYAATFGTHAIALFNSSDVFLSGNSKKDVYEDTVNYRANTSTVNAVAATTDALQLTYLDDSFQNSWYRFPSASFVTTTDGHYNGTASGKAIFPSSGTWIEYKSPGAAKDMSTYWDSGFLSMYVKSDAASEFRICLINGDVTYRSSLVKVTTTTEWTYVKIPLASFGANNTDSASSAFKTNVITGFELLHASTVSVCLGRTFFLDDIKIYKTMPATATATLYYDENGTKVPTDHMVIGQLSLDVNVNATIGSPFVIVAAVYDDDSKNLEKEIAVQVNAINGNNTYTFDLGTWNRDDVFAKVFIWYKDSLKPIFEQMIFVKESN